MRHHLTLTLPITLAGAALSTAALLLSACSSGPNKETLTEGLNNALSKDPVCWNVPHAEGVSLTLPVQAVLPESTINPESQPILNGLLQAGYITVGRPASQGWSPASALNIDTTEAGKIAQVWDVHHGFCMGTRVVNEVQSFTDPDKDPHHAVKVRYTWVLSKSPTWFNDHRAAFGAVPGLAPVGAQAIMVKGPHGWDVQADSNPLNAPTQDPASGPVGASS